jgi:3-oxoacyl-[acyl-carrier protein] reductase
MELNLAGRRAFVTGASRGIGLAIVRGLASEGAVVSFCARDPKGLGEAEAIHAREGHTVHPYAVDVTDHAALEATIRRSAEERGGLDLLVANAGGSRGAGLQTSTSEDWMHTLAINVVHAATAIRTAVPWLMESGEGAALVIASISGWKPRASSAYAVAKAAEIHLAPVLAVELALERIRVNTLSPGSVSFEGGRWARTRAADPEAHERFVAENLPGGRFVTPEEVADVACFLLSSRANGINGAHICVDGGQDRPTDRKVYP